MKTLKIAFFVVISLPFMRLNAQEMTTFDTKEYSIQYPIDWTFDTSGQMNTTFIIFSKREKADIFRENVNLIIQDLSNQILNLEAYTELSLKGIKAMKNVKIIESKQIKHHEKKAQQIIWSGFVSGKDLKLKQVYFIENNNAYVLTLTCEKAAYDTYVNTGTAILNSFILK